MENEVHFIILPRTEDLLAWCVWLVPVISLLLWDVWKAWKRRAIWIPGHALVLSALIIQLLSFTDYSHISVYSGSSYKTKEVVAVLVKNQLVIDSGRLMMCVLMAYLLPGMARSGSTMVGSDLTALALSIILNIVSELKSVLKVKKPNELSSAPPPDFNLETKWSDIKWSRVSGSILFITIIYLLLLLIHAAMIGRSIRKIMSQKIPSALSCCCNPCEKRQCNNTKDHVIKCWIVARASQPDYVLARSRLSSNVGQMVTVCVVISVIKWRYVQLTDYESLNRANRRTLAQFVIVGQFAIVLIGWIVVCIRWMNFALWGDISSLEYFQSISIQDAQDDLNVYLARLLVMDKRIQEKRIRDIKEKRRVSIIEKFRPYSDSVSLLLNPQHWRQKIRVPLSKLRWYFFQVHLIALMRTPVKHILSSIFSEKSSSAPVAENGQFSKYKKALEIILMPGERASSLWTANLWGLTKVENYMDQGQDEGKRSPYESMTAEGEAGTSANEEKAHLLQANKNSWKRTAVSVIHFMIYFYHSSDVSASKVIENAIQSYIQTWEYVSFIDSLNDEVKSLGRGADKEFESLKNIWDQREQSQVPLTKLTELIKKMESLSNKERCNLQNSKDWTEAANNCLFETWKVVDHYSSTAIDKIHRLQCLLAKVIFSYMTEDLEKAVIEKCNKLAEKGMEQEILDVGFILAKAQGVMDKVLESNNQVDDAGNLEGNNQVDDAGKTDHCSINSAIETGIEEVREGNNGGHYNAKRTGNSDQIDLTIELK